MDGSGIPVPETPINGPNDDSGLELIGQEVVIHRTIHQSTGQTPTAALPIESLVTPTRPTTRSVTSALAENSNQGGLDGNGGIASEMQMVRTYPRGTPMSSEMQRMPYPKGSPIAYGPSSSVGDQSQQLPLFTQDQLRRLHDLQSQAPQFYDERIARPSFLQTEENRLGSSGVVGFPQFPMTPEVRDELKRQEESMKNQVDLLRQQVQQLAQQNQPLREINKTLKEENELLKLRLSLFDVAPGTPVFATPNPSTEKEHGRMGPETNFTVGFEVPKNDKATENDLTQNAEAFENAPAFEYAHVPESFKAFEYQEKNLLEGDEALKNVQGKRSHHNTEETYGNNHGGGRADPSSSSSGDQSRQNGEMLHLMAKMMEGMSSLQKQILDGKDPKAAKAEAVEEQEKDEQVPPSSSTTEDRSQEPTVKGLLEEATKVLKSISSTNSTTTKPKASASDNQRDQLMDNLQRQLDQLRSSQSTSLKVLRLSRLAKGTLMGLIDSGATHALRPLQPLEDKSEMSPVEVTLADGNKKRLMMTKEGTMITDSPEVEPIIPMGILTAKLGCEVVWSGDQVTIRHPTRGEIDVTCVDGCPMIRRSLALELIEEAEKVGMRAAFCNLSVEREQLWLQQLVDSHPILRQLPGHVKESLTTGIGEWKDLPVNKRLRKRFRRDGFTVHLFAGKDEGQTLKKTFQQMGGNSENLLELDILRDQRHDFLTGGGVYGSLLRAAMDNRLLALLGGPNCRTRSVLRHKPIEGKEDYPKPVRSWMENQIYGLLQLGEEDRKKVEDDDVMLWRMVFLFMVATYVNKASCNPKPLIGFLLEQPASPREYEPECVSLWDQEDWKGISQEFGLQECTVNQSDFGGSATKPTTFANNLDLQPSLESRRPRGKIQVNNSKMLSRWAPGVMHMISLALKSKIYNEMGHLRAMSWKEHVDHQHYPFRRDCKICQESLQRDLPHRKVKHPLCGVLSADTSSAPR